jgi:DNA-binding transcriptional ArsR family regulator
MTETLSTTLSALADPTRLEIMRVLSRGPANVSDLVDLFDLAQPTISKHLKVLESAGLISRGRIGRTRPCQLDPRNLRHLELWLHDRRAEWESRLDYFEAHLERMKERNPDD